MGRREIAIEEASQRIRSGLDGVGQSIDQSRKELPHSIRYGMHTGIYNGMNHDRIVEQRRRHKLFDRARDIIGLPLSIETGDHPTILKAEFVSVSALQEVCDQIVDDAAEMLMLALDWFVEMNHIHRDENGNCSAAFYMFKTGSNIKAIWWLPPFVRADHLTADQAAQLMLDPNNGAHLLLKHIDDVGNTRSRWLSEYISENRRGGKYDRRWPQKPTIDDVTITGHE